ncbi:hypothetical protein ACLD9I_004687 [Pseudomonas aeruginosa]
MKTRLTFATSALALLALAGCASQPESARAVLTASAAGGQHIVWDYDQDFLLEEQQAAALKAVPKGAPMEVAAKIVEVVGANGSMGGRQPSGYPIALACAHPDMTVVTTVSLSDSYLKQGCVIVRQI